MAAARKRSFVPADDNMTILRRFFDALKHHDSRAAADLMASDVVTHFSGLPAPVHGIHAWRQLFGSYAAAFADVQITVADEIADGDKAVVRYSWTATHQAAFMGIPATGKRVSNLVGVGVYRIADGKIAEEWIVEDTVGLLLQLGVIPTPVQLAMSTS
jgi:steroid delta-isomerase-like uncharacterized protein